MIIDFYWLAKPINITQSIFIDNIDWNQLLIFIDWNRPEVKGRDLGKTYRQARTYYIFGGRLLFVPV